MTHVAPEWAIVRRRDHGLAPDVLDTSWGAAVVPASRGLPFTDFENRRMGAPAGNHPSAKAVRAHELVHATISPMHLTDELIEQLQVSHEAIVLAEEMRVNFVLSQRADRLGVDMKALKDGSELRDAKAAVMGKDFVTVLSTVCSTMFAGAERSVAREVQGAYPVIRAFRKQVKRLLARDHYVASTQITHHPIVVREELPVGDPRDNGLGYVEKHSSAPLPRGFTSTVEIAQIIDGLLPRKGEGTSEYNERISELGEKGETARGEGAANWATLRFGAVPLNGNGTGFLSRTRKASGLGRVPRRLHRLLTDPERRVFDRVARKSGGVVLVDGSGSMSLTSNDLREIVRAAPGCTVAVYSYPHGSTAPNIWIVARQGRYALPVDFPDIGADNCVDVPAINWAVSKRDHPTDPVIWVSDGHVTIPHAGMTHQAGVDAVNACHAGKVVQVLNVEAAVETLREAAQGKRPTPKVEGWLSAIEAGMRRSRVSA